MNLQLNQDDNFNLINLNILITCLLDIVCVLWREVTFQSPLGVRECSKGLFKKKGVKYIMQFCSDHSIFWFFGNHRAMTVDDFTSALLTSVSIFSKYSDTNNEYLFNHL